MAPRIMSRPASSVLFLRLVRHSSTRSSTSAMAYKAQRQRHGPLPVEAPPAWSAHTAVSNILYEMPTPSKAPPKRHVLCCLVQNEPGVLSRVSGTLAARGFNIDSLAVCSTEVEDLSRMTIALTGQDGVVEQARRQLEDLVPVWAVLDYTNSALVQRELLLAKINILGPEYFHELLAHHREITEAESNYYDSVSHSDAEASVADQHPGKPEPSSDIQLKTGYLVSITHFTHQFGGKVLDIGSKSCIVELSAKPSKINSYLQLIAPFGILESTRTGLMALPRSTIEPKQEAPVREADDVVDASQLPPG